MNVTTYNALKKVHSKKENRDAVKDFLFSHGIIVEKNDSLPEIAHAVYKVFQESYKETANNLKGFDYNCNDTYFHSPEFQRQAFSDLLKKSVEKGFLPAEPIKNFDLKKAIKGVATTVKNTHQAPVLAANALQGKTTTQDLQQKLVKDPILKPANLGVQGENLGRKIGSMIYGTVGKAIPQISSYATMGEAVENAKLNLINKGANASGASSGERTDYGKTPQTVAPSVSNLPVKPELTDEQIKALAEAQAKEEAEKQNSGKKDNSLMYSGLLVTALLALKFII